MKALAHLGQRLSRAALGNARRALDEVRDHRADRLALQDPESSRVMQLTTDESIDLLLAQDVGRLAYVARAGQPDVVPVNYVWSEGAVLVRSGPGPKLQAAQRRETMVLQVDEIEPTTRSGRSVVVVGKAHVLDPWRPTPPIDAWAGEPRRHVIRIVPARIDGRVLRPTMEPAREGSGS
jgi:hypothetical protein